MNVYHKMVLEEHTEDVQDFINARMLLDEINRQNKLKSVYNQHKLENTLQNVFCTWIIRNKSGKIYREIGHILQMNGGYIRAYLYQWGAAVKRKCRL